MTIDTPAVPPGGYFSKASDSFMDFDLSSSEYQQCVGSVSGPQAPVAPLGDNAHPIADSWAVAGNPLTAASSMFDGNLGNSIDIFSSPKGYDAECSNLDMMAKRSVEGGAPQGISAANASQSVTKSRHSTTTLLPTNPSRRGISGAAHMEEHGGGAYVSTLNPSDALATDRCLLDSCIRANNSDDGGIFASSNMDDPSMRLDEVHPYPAAPSHGTAHNRWTTALPCPTGHTQTDNNLSGYISSGSGCEDLGQTDTFCEMFPSSSAIVRDLVGNAIRPATAAMDVKQQGMAVS